MRKQKRNKGKQQPTQQAHVVRFPRVGYVRLPPSRESTTPFCCYYGPHGETCSETTRLAMVWRMPSNPPVMYFACPLHAEVVYHMVQAFLARLEKLSKQV